MTDLELHNNIRTICPVNSAFTIVNHCINHNYNQARIILDDLYEDERHKLDQQFLSDDVIAFNTMLKKINDYQLIWNEVVHRFENQHND
jgi:predicted RND superfamily exporter protein